MLILKKLARDLWLTRTRALIMVVSIAVGLIAFNTLIGARSVLTREVVRNYMDSKPASIILEMNEVTPQVLRAVRARDDIEGAVRRAQVHGRFSTLQNAEKKRAFFFVVDDFSDMPIAKIARQSGALPPPPSTVLIERSAVPVVGGGEGTLLKLSLPSGAASDVKISGIVHEPALAPANTEQAVYAYITQAELARLGQPVTFTELRVLPRGALDIGQLEQKSRELTKFIETAGLGRVTAIRVPPPHHHPHQSQMTTVLNLFVIFSALIVVLSSLLTGSLIATMMARQIREMGVMKTLGARSVQLTLAYALLVELVAGVALALSWYPSRIGAQLFIKSITKLLNFDVLNDRQSSFAISLQIAVAFVVPLLIALPALYRGSRVTVKQALVDFGVRDPGRGASKLEAWVARVSAGSEFFKYAVRSAVRRRGRFALSLALLSTAGGIFLAALSTAGSWRRVTSEVHSSRHYDFEVGFAHALDTEPLAKDLLNFPEIERVETWRSTRTAPASDQDLPIERTYPDGAHGAFQLVAPPQDSTMLSVKLKEGNFVNHVNQGEVVINQLVPNAAQYHVGDQIVLAIDGKKRSLIVGGKIEEVGAGAVAYVNEQTFLSVVELEHRSSILRVKAASGVQTASALARVNQVLESAHAPVTHVSPLSVFENAVAAHFEIMINALLALAVLTVCVGALGLGAALSANVAEGASELGVLRALGATGSQLRSLVMREALLVSGSSVVLSIALGLALSALIGNIIGMMSFQVPLPFVPSHVGMLGLLVGTLGLGALSSIPPARHASQITVAGALRAL